ncbi:MAG: hypothetical protein AAF790_12470, partial [Planctomycetota bacterium]
ILGDLAGASGEAFVSGVGVDGGVATRSRLRVSRRGTQSELDVGRLGDGRLTIQAGGLVDVGGNMRIATGAAAVGEVIVQGGENGFGAELRVGRTITVGGAGEATLRLGAGGLISADRMTLSPTATLDVTGGRLELGTLDLPAPTTLEAGMFAIDTINGDVTFGAGAIVDPGDSPGLTTINGDANFLGSIILFDLAGTAPADYDRLQITGEFSGSAEAVVTLRDGFLPQAGDVFRLVEAGLGVGGVLSSMPVNLPALPSGLAWEFSGADPLAIDLAVVLEGLAGDFNGDGRVDGADYAVWRGGLGTVYTVSDLDVWRANFGAVHQPAPVAVGVSSVPEPHAAMALLGAVALVAARRRA